MFPDTLEQIIVISPKITHARGDLIDERHNIYCLTNLCTSDDFANHKRRVEGIAFRAIRDLLHDSRGLVIMSGRGQRLEQAQFLSEALYVVRLPTR